MHYIQYIYRYSVGMGVGVRVNFIQCSVFRFIYVVCVKKSGKNINKYSKRKKKETANKKETFFERRQKTPL